MPSSNSGRPSAARADDLGFEQYGDAAIVRMPYKMFRNIVVGWLDERADRHEYEYYLAQRRGQHDDAARIKIEFCNDVKKLIEADVESRP